MKIYLLLFSIFTFSLFSNQEVLFIKNEGQVKSDILYYAQYDGLNIFLKEDGFYYDFYEEVNRNDKSVTKKGHVVKLDFEKSKFTTLKSKDNSTKYNYIKGNDKTKWFKNVETTKEIVLNNIYDHIDLRVYFDKNMPRYDIILNPNADPSQIKFNFKSAFNSIVEDNKIKTFINIGEFESSDLFAYQIVNNEKQKIECSFQESNDGMIEFKIGEYDKSKKLVIDPIVYSSLLNWFGDDYIKSIATIDDYNYYVAGVTTSPDFPTTTGVYQKEFGLEEDIFIAKFYKKGTENILKTATFFGGSDKDILSNIIYKNNKLYFGGSTLSSDFPNKNFANNTYKGNQDGFVAVLNDSLNKLDYAYFVGGSEVDGINDIAISNGKVFFGGYTNSLDLNTVSAFQNVLKGRYDCMFGASRPNGSSFEFLTYLGGSMDDKVNGIDVDDLEYIYWIATTESGDFITYPRGGWGDRNKAYDTDFNGGTDMMIGRFSEGAGLLQLCTYFGGFNNDYGVDVVANSGKNYYFLGYSEKEETQTIETKEGLIQKQNAGEIDILFGRMSDVIAVKFGLSNFFETQDVEISTFIGGKNNDIPLSLAKSPNGQSFFITGTTNSTNFPQINNEVKTPRLEGKYDGLLCEVNIFGSKISYSSFIGGSEDDKVNAAAYFPNGNFIYGGETTSDDFYSKGLNSNIERNNLDAFIGMSNIGQFNMNSPNGGNSYCPGYPISSVWSYTDFPEGDGFNIYLINNKLNTKELIGEKIKNKVYSWIVPNSVIPDSSYKILIEHPNGFYATSQNNFIINQTPKIEEFKLDKSKYCVGDSVRLTAKVKDVYNAKYNWKFNNKDLYTTDTNNIIIKNLQPNNSGKYSLSLKGECDPNAISEDINIDVAPLTSIDSKTDDLELLKGEKLELILNAIGGDLTYQWKLNNNNLSGQTKSTLTIAVADFADEGNYTCEVNGRCGESVTSDPINVTITSTKSVSNSQLLDTFYYDGNNINTELKVNYSGLAITQIIDLSGKEVYSDNIYLSQGTNKLEIPADFENGTYLFSVIVNHKVISYKFAIIK